MGADFYDLQDQKHANLLHSLDTNSAAELEWIFLPASSKWGDILSIGKDTRILASQLELLIALIDGSGKRGAYTEFYHFLIRCRDGGIDLKVYAD